MTQPTRPTQPARVDTLDPHRRSLIKAAGGVAAASTLSGLIPGLQAAVHAAGSDKPEKEEVRIGFIPLTDCASVVMASRAGHRPEVRRQDHPEQGGQLGRRP